MFTMRIQDLSLKNGFVSFPLPLSFLNKSAPEQLGRIHLGRYQRGGAGEGPWCQSGMSELDQHERSTVQGVTAQCGVSGLRGVWKATHARETQHIAFKTKHDGGERIPAGWRWWQQWQFKPGCIQGD